MTLADPKLRLRVNISTHTHTPKEKPKKIIESYLTQYNRLREGLQLKTLSVLISALLFGGLGSSFGL